MDVSNAIPQWFTGSEHTHRVAAAIAQYGPITRTTLAQMLGLSQGAMSRITGSLIYDGVIEELPQANAVGQGKLPDGFTPKESSQRRGRPQTALSLCSNARTFVGVKIHGKSAVAAAVNAHGEVVSGRHEQSFTDQSPDSVTAIITQLVQDCANDIAAAHLPQPTAIGVAVGGHIAYDSVVTFGPFLHWNNDVDLGAMVFSATGLPCGIFNDIDSLLLDACWFGPGVGLEMFAVVTIGVGVGYSLAVRGVPVTYPDKSYGLAGHILLDSEGPLCSSGHVGCAQCLTDDSIAEQYSAEVGHMVTFEDFVADVHAGVAQANRLLNRTCFRLGTLVATIANLAMPSMVMIAGESAFLAKTSVDSIRDGIARYRHNQAAPAQFTVVEHDWQLWAKAAASRVIVKHIG